MTEMNWVEKMIQAGKYPSFKREYDSAVSEGKSEFVFDEQYFLTRFAYYVCEYVESLSDTRTEQERVRDAGRA